MIIIGELQFDIAERINDLDFVHFVDEAAVFASYKNVVLRRSHGASKFVPIATLPCSLLDRLKLSSKLSRRVF